MKKMFLILSTGLLLVVVGCEETIVLDLTTEKPLVVIQGTITNELKRHVVTVDRSGGFYEMGGPSAITNATVSVACNGQNIQFKHNPGNHPDSLRYYVSEIPFTGEVGNTYKLSVAVEDNIFEATDVLAALTPIDSLSYAVDETEAENPKEEGFIYEVYFYMKEPQATKDYYLFKFYRNGKEVYDSYESVYVSDDELLKENIDGVSAASFYKLGDTVQVRAFSLSNKVYRFYSDVAASLSNDGGIFGPPPSNLRSNLTGGAIGVFQASYVREKSIIIR